MEFSIGNNLIAFKKGFTLVELLIVISILGILAAFTMSIMNTRQQKARAEDSVRQATVSKLGQIIDAFYVAEGFYPGSVYPSGNPLGTGVSPGPNRTTLLNYVGVWPVQNTEFYGTYLYYPITEGTVTVSCVSINMATNSSKYLKYINPHHPGYVGGDPICTGKVVKNCMFPCDHAFWGNDLTECVQIDETDCIL